MKKIIDTVKNDFVNYRDYHFLEIMFILTLFFGLLMGLTSLMPPIIYIYLSVFVLPVITFSVSLFIEAQQKTVLPNVLDDNHHPSLYAIGKILSATLIQIIPMIFYLMVMIFVLGLSFNILFFMIVYMLSTVIHIIIGLSLSIIAKTAYTLSLSYLVYLIVFSVIPILYSFDFFSADLSYILIISPAFLSGVLFESLVNQYSMMDPWFNYISLGLILTYIVVLFMYVIKPFIVHYLKENYE
ncbi:MAG: hypothetical protein PF513_07345 [Tenericutes bacterium]|jgi:hypothetical protein|nr:hypothetical protein [Mycoplasmatota bacterium]